MCSLPANSASLNPQTGIFSITPCANQQAALSVIVLEYRVINGVRTLIGSIERDMQLIVMNCGTNHSPIVSAPSNVQPATSFTVVNNNINQFNLCAGTPLSFQVTATDIDTADVLTALIDNLPQGASVTQTGTNPKVLTFTWTPTAGDGGVHNFVLETIDNFCPLSGRVQQFYSINVQNLNFNITQTTICNGTPAAITLNALPAYAAQGAIYTWSANPLPANFNPSSTSGLYTAIITQPTTFTVVYSGNTCAVSATKSIQGYGGVAANPPYFVYDIASNPPLQALASYLNPPPVVPPSSGLGSGQVCNGAAVNHTIGTGTQSTSLVSSVGTPFQGFWHDGRFQMVLTASELQAGGLQFGLINSLAFDIVQKGSTIPYSNFTIKMGPATSTVFVSGFVNTNTNVVYSSPAYTTTLGVNTFNLQTPFFWNAVDNLLIEICYDNTAYTGYDEVNYTQTTSNQVVYRRVDNAIGCSLTVGNTSLYRPNIILGNCAVTVPNSNIVYNWTSATGTIQNPTTANPILIGSGIAGTTDLFIVTATDGICTSSDTVIVFNTNTCSVYANIQSSGSLGCLQSGVSLDAQTYSSGTGMLSYAWNNGSTNPILQATTAGVYTVTISSNPLGCTATASATVVSSGVSFNAAISATHDTLSCHTSTTILTATPSQSGNSYQWSNNASTAQIAVTTGGVYTVTVTNTAIGCSSSASYLINSSQTLPTGFSNFVSTQVLTCNTTSVIIDACSTLPNNHYSYEWNNGSQSCILTASQAGSYTVTVRDSVTGCGLNLVAVVSALLTPPLPYVAISTPPAPLGCGSATLSASVANPQSNYTYAWNTGAVGSTFVANTFGRYLVTVTDAQTGCTGSTAANFQSVQAVSNLLAISDCNAATGQVLLNIYYGISPYTIQFDGNTVATTSNTSYTFTNVGVGVHLVGVVSADGCVWSSSITMTCPDAVLNGLVFDDTNNNGLFDTGEMPIANQLISAFQNGQVWYGVSNANGIYTINVPTVGNYTLSVPYLQSSQSVSTSNLNVVATLNTTTTTNIGMHTSASTFDLAVSVYHANLRPGTSTNYYLNYTNYGSLPVSNAKLKLYIQGFVPSSFNSTVPYTVVNDTLIVLLGTVPASYSGNVLVQVAVPVTTPIGLAVTSTAIISPLNGDTNSANNIYTRQAVTTSSYDPNDKRVNIASYTYEELATGGLVTPSPELEYIIRFQNTGSDTAFTVKITDTLSSFLNLATFKMVGSSHPCMVQIANDRVATFTFNNIQLPHTAINEPKSHGFVVYTLHPDDNLIQNGVPIRNAASIFFDLNPPIYTNQVYTTPSRYLIAVPHLDPRYSFTLIPNPVESNVTVTPNLFETKEATFVIRNMLGQIMRVQTIQNEHATILSVSDFAQGVYSTEIWVNEKLVATKRLVKM